EISAPTVLNDNLNITNNSSNAFTISGTISSTNTVALSLLSGDATFSNVISDGTGLLAISQSGTGTLKLSGANTYSGGTTITGGTLALGSDSVLTLGVITSGPVGTGTLTLDGTINPVTLSSDGATARTIFNNVSLNGGDVTLGNATK